MTIRFKERLEGVHPDLVRLFTELEKDKVHILIVEGVRTTARQRQLVQAGASRTMASKHLIQPTGFGHAVDVVPTNSKGQINWEDITGFRKLRQTILDKAEKLGIRVRHGADWDMNNIIDELEVREYIKRVGRRPFVDYPHWELVGNGSVAVPKPKAAKPKAKPITKKK